MNTRITAKPLAQRNIQKSILALLLPIALLLIGWQNVFAASITTDQLDYPPFTDVYVSGTGFGTNEVVQMTLETLDADGINWTVLPGDPAYPNPWNINSDTNGAISDAWYVYSLDFIGVTFRLTAVGQNSGETAQTIFTDAPNTVDLELISKLDAPDPVAAGANITYTINIKNQGPNKTANPFVTDVLPGGTTFVSATVPAGWTATTPSVGASGTVTWTFTGDLKNNDTATFTLVVKVNCSVANGSSIANTATIAFATGAGDTDPNTANNSKTATTAVTDPSPTITCPGNISATTDSGTCSAFVTYVVETSGPTPPSLSYAFTGATTGSGSGTGSGSTTFSTGITTVTITATGACGPETCYFTVTVCDAEPPTITAVGANATIECPATPVFSTPTASDDCGSATLTFGDVTTPGDCAGSYSVTRTWTATDDCGNSSQASQTINVIDTTAPVIAALPGPTTINCPATPAFATATATDACGSAFTLTFADATTTGDCAGSYSVTRTWTATDGCGNSSQASQTINVIDTTAPVIAALPGPTTINCPATPAFATATATDACGSAFTLTFADATTTGDCAGSYSVTRTWTATDDCGNSSLASQTINVIDTTAPTITCPDNIVVANSGACSAVVVDLPPPTVSDNCGGAVAVVCTRSDGKELTDGYPVGVTTITCTAKDSCGNTLSCSYTLTVTTDRSIASNFNGTSIPGNSTIWFSSVIKPSLHGACPVTVKLLNQTIKSSKFNLVVPDSEIHFVAGACPATTVYANGVWVTTVGCDFTGNIFLSGLAYKVPAAGLPGGINPVTWSGTFATDNPGVTVNWIWAAAVYTTFAADNNAIGIKPVDGSKCTTYLNSDHAGTPENYKASVIGGARGGGGSNWTGSLSGTLGVAPCD